MDANLCFLAFLSVFLVYSFLVMFVVAVLIFKYAPRYGQSHMIIYVGICSLMGSLTVCFLFYLWNSIAHLNLYFIFPWLWQFSYFSSGYECQSSSYCCQVDIWRNESIQVLRDMVLQCVCGWLLYFAGDLLEQGNISKHSIILMSQLSY